MTGRTLTVTWRPTRSWPACQGYDAYVADQIGLIVSMVQHLRSSGLRFEPLGACARPEHADGRAADPSGFSISRLRLAGAAVDQLESVPLGLRGRPDRRPVVHAQACPQDTPGVPSSIRQRCHSVRAASVWSAEEQHRPA